MEFEGAYTDNVVKSETSAMMREILESVVNEGGGKNAKVDGYRIGGKTGTAQKYENGTIARGKYVSTCLGFTPADDPEYIALMIVDEPQAGAYYGSIVAAPYVGEIFSKIFSYRGMEPVGLENPEQFAMPDLLGMTITDAVLELKKYGMSYEIDGEGGVVRYQMPAPGAMVTKNNVALIQCS